MRVLRDVLKKWEMVCHCYYYYYHHDLNYQSMSGAGSFSPFLACHPLSPPFTGSSCRNIDTPAQIRKSPNCSAMVACSPETDQHPSAPFVISDLNILQPDKNQAHLDDAWSFPSLRAWTSSLSLRWKVQDIGWQFNVSKPQWFERHLKGDLGPVVMNSTRQQWATGGSEILIPCPGLEPG